MNIGTKVRILEHPVEAFVGQHGVIEGMAPDINNTSVYKVRVNDMILPGWFTEEMLEELFRPYTTLIFDLDGTLTDSGKGIMHSAEYALARIGIIEPDPRILKAFVGPPLEDSFRMLYGLSDEEVNKAAACYRDHYFRLGIYEQTPYQDIDQVLRKLRNDGYRLAIGTTKPMQQALLVLDILGIRDLFDAVGAGDNEGRLHTKADVLNSLLGYMGMNSSKASCVMIGDRRFDVEGARQVGIDCIGVLWGYGDRQELQTAGAKYIAEDYNQLLHII